MGNNFKKFGFLIIFTLCIVPQITFAAWWDPTSWFSDLSWLPHWSFFGQVEKNPEIEEVVDTTLQDFQNQMKLATSSNPKQYDTQEATTSVYKPTSISVKKENVPNFDANASVRKAPIASPVAQKSAPSSGGGGGNSTPSSQPSSGSGSSVTTVLSATPSVAHSGGGGGGKSCHLSPNFIQPSIDNVIIKNKLTGVAPSDLKKGEEYTISWSETDTKYPISIYLDRDSSHKLLIKTIPAAVKGNQSVDWKLPDDFKSDNIPNVVTVFYFIVVESKGPSCGDVDYTVDRGFISNGTANYFTIDAPNFSSGVGSGGGGSSSGTSDSSQVVTPSIVSASYVLTDDVGKIKVDWISKGASAVDLWFESTKDLMIKSADTNQYTDFRLATNGPFYFIYKNYLSTPNTFKLHIDPVNAAGARVIGLDRQVLDITVPGSTIDANPKIDNINPTSGPIGTIITLSGSNFNSSLNTVGFENNSGAIKQFTLGSTDGKTLVFTVPTTFTQFSERFGVSGQDIAVSPGTYTIAISNDNGKTTTYFTVTSSGRGSGGGGSSGSSDSSSGGGGGGESPSSN